MKELYFTNEEINLLLSFIGETSIFDVDNKNNISNAAITLHQKGYLDSGITPNKNTVAIVEALRLYNEGKFYLRFQDAVISLGNSKMCVLKKTIINEEEKKHDFRIMNIKTMIHILYLHPLIRYFDSHTREEQLEPSQLVLEFYKNNILTEHLRIEYANNQWFTLNNHYEIGEEIEEINALDWLLQRLPNDYVNEYQLYVQEVLSK
ncbi:MAG: hypothetical protein ACK5LC_10740 [Coprobacillaceae bacterium]